ncbi:hypothetical protein D3C87_298550 [compost metagenome]
MDNKHSPKFLRQRKFLTVLPVLVFPFMTLAFWAMGGGTETVAAAPAKGGINIDVPGANLKDERNMDKMQFYNAAEKDSAKMRDLKKSDPYYQNREATDQNLILDQQRLGFTGSGFATTPSSYGAAYTNPQEQKVYQRLDLLNKALTQPVDPLQQQPYAANNFGAPKTAGVTSADVDRLEQMMKAMQGGNEPDPEMNQLNGMLEKIMAIQNPGLVQEKLRQTSEQRKGRVYAVSTGKQADPVSTLDKEGVAKPTGNRGNDKEVNGFFSFDNTNTAGTVNNAISAVIHEDQTITTGSIVKLRLTSDIFINGQLIPKGSFIHGIASLSGERLGIKIGSIRYNNNLYTTELAVFDMDGLDGIYIPGAISREVAKESADRGLQNIGFQSMDPTLEMQAATVGVEAAKSLFSKKVKLIRVTVKAGYQVLLRDEKQKDQD